MLLKKFLERNTYFFRYISPEYNVLARRGKIYCFVQASAKHTGRLDVIVKMMWEAVLDKYLHHEGSDIITNLEDASKSGEHRLRELIKKDEDFREEGVDVNFLILVLKDSKLYIQKFGDIKICLLRNKKYIDISQYLDKFHKKSGSTILRKEDLFLLGTSDIVNDIVGRDYNFDYIEKRVETISDREGLVLFTEKEALLQTSEELVEQKDLSGKDSLNEITGRILQKTSVSDTIIDESLSDKDKIVELQEESEVKSDQPSLVSGLNDLDGKEGNSGTQDSIQENEDRSDDSIERGDLMNHSQSLESEQEVHIQQQDSQFTDSEEIDVKDNNVEDSGLNKEFEYFKKDDKIKKESNKSVQKSGLGQVKEKKSQERFKEDVDNKKRMFSKKSSDEVDKKDKNMFARITEDIGGLSGNLTPDKIKMKLTTFKDELQAKISEIGIFGMFKVAFDKVLFFFSWLVEQIMKIFAFIFGFISNLLAKKYGREPWFKRLSARISQLKLNNLSGSNVKGSRVDNYKGGQTQKKFLSYIFLVVVVFGLGYMGYKWTQKRADIRESRANMQMKIEEAESYLEEAEKLVVNDRNAAQLKAYKANLKLEEAEQYVVSDKDEGDILGVKTRLKDIDDRVNQRVRLTEKDESIDLYLDGILKFGEKSQLEDLIIREDSNGKEHLYLTDSGISVIYDIDLYTKEIETLPDEGNLLKSPLYIANGVDKIFAYDGDVGLVYSQLDEEGKFQSFRKATGMGTDTLSGRGIVDLAIWTGRENSYFIAQEDAAMLKSIKISEVGYGLPMTYVEDLQDGTDLFGDSSFVYTLAKGKDGLKRYKSQNGKLVESPMGIVGVYPDPNGLIAGFTSTDTKRIYAFDDSENRLLLFDKSDQNQLVLHEQLIYSGDKDNAWEGVKDMVVDKREEYLYLLDGVRLWRIEL